MLRITNFENSAVSCAGSIIFWIPVILTLSTSDSAGTHCSVVKLEHIFLNLPFLILSQE